MHLPAPVTAIGASPNVCRCCQPTSPEPWRQSSCPSLRRSCSALRWPVVFHAVCTCTHMSTMLVPVAGQTATGQLRYLRCACTCSQGVRHSPATTGVCRERHGCVRCRSGSKSKRSSCWLWAAKSCTGCLGRYEHRCMPRGLPFIQSIWCSTESCSLAGPDLYRRAQQFQQDLMSNHPSGYHRDLKR